MHDAHASLRTPIKRARGLGSAKDGTGHFWLQRVSAVALIPLTVWFMVSLITHLIGADRAGVAQWLSHPLVALAMAALIAAMFIHARLGIQVIVEDYVHHEGKKIVALLLNNALILGFGGASLFAIARLHFIGI
ncbi:MAG: succinate dehydrogenase, hydrophobic membrane anchor protein [Pseudomonadota bacterium]